MVVSTWDRIWKDIENINFNKETFMWRFYEILLGDYDFKDKKVLEIGCGTGINSIFMAMRGARVTFLDSSPQALRIVKGLLDGFSLKGEIVKGDAFDYKIGGEFDLVHSEGVVEHFLGKERQDIIDIHSRALKRNGLAVVIVPNRKCLPYRLGKLMAEKTGSWIYGNEYPYSGGELAYRLGRAGLEPGRVIGGEFLFSFGWLLSFLWMRSNRVVGESISFPANRSVVGLNYDNVLANRWGRVIGCVGKRVTTPQA